MRATRSQWNTRTGMSQTRAVGGSCCVALSSDMARLSILRHAEYIERVPALRRIRGWSINRRMPKGDRDAPVDYVC
jgi:hypothetical protein